VASILVVDDEPGMREVLEIMLRREGHAVSCASNVGGARKALAESPFDVVISDIRMPDGTGLEVLQAARLSSPDAIVLMITAFATTETAIEAMQRGAYDYVTKPFQIEEVKLLLRKALETQALKHENRSLRQALVGRYGFRGIVGASPAMKRVFELMERIKDTRTTVLLTGESGTGKELVAQAIHYNSVRKEKSFVAVNCGAIPANLLESELFGHAKGAFTGAVASTDGLFLQASGGTLFLDEISELPTELQVKLLRALQERKVRPVGGVQDLEVDVRIIAATNRDLAQEVESGRFRQDLYYRLNVVEIELPPLRERREDIPLLALHFVQKYAAETGRDIKTIAPEAMQLIENRPYPGNVRELENLIERAIVLESSNAIQAGSLPPLGESAAAAAASAALVLGDSGELPAAGIDFEAVVESLERRLIGQALARTGGNKSEAAKLLKLTFRSFRYRCAKYGF